MLAIKPEHQLACHAQFYFIHDIILVGFLLLPIKAARPSKEELSKEKAKAADNSSKRNAEGAQLKVKQE